MRGVQARRGNQARRRPCLLLLWAETCWCSRCCSRCTCRSRFVLLLLPYLLVLRLFGLLIPQAYCDYPCVFAVLTIAFRWLPLVQGPRSGAAQGPEHRV